ncbi:MAG: hypothetical protein M3R54_07440 [Chloroflexota bacterium]|nr:hypothetical protein [Chloroflexota bacterium]
MRALGLEPSSDGAAVALVDTRSDEALRVAALLPPAIPRVGLVAESDLPLLAALGIDASRLVRSLEPAVLGPVIMSLVPSEPRPATRVVVVSGVRGGVGRTMLAANLARRISAKLRVCVVDATGSGAVSWWLGCTPRPWVELEGLADELSADHLALLAESPRAGIHVLGGAPHAPTVAVLGATVRAAMALDDLVIVDAPNIGDHLTRALRVLSPRLLVLAYDDPWSTPALHSDPARDDAWILASQSRSSSIGTLPVFRALPRDEAAVAAALGSRALIRGALGKAYDELAELLVIDAT